MFDRLVFGCSDNSERFDDMVSAPIEGLSLARWQDFYHIRELPENCLNDKFGSAAVYQFAISKVAPDFVWNDKVNLSPTVLMLREAMQRDDVLGLVVQFSISGTSAPVKAYGSKFWELHGTIGLWCKDELKTYPHGRLLTPRQSSESSSRESQPMGNLTVQLTPRGASLNMITVIPCVASSSELEDESNQIFSKLDLGDLELRTVDSYRLIARIPREAYQKEAHQLTSGLVDISYGDNWEDLRKEVEKQSLCIIGTVNNQQQIFLEEKEVNLQVDDACLFIENSIVNESGLTVDLEIRSFYNGI